jgi:hypothetical protein
MCACGRGLSACVGVLVCVCVCVHVLVYVDECVGECA